MFPRRHHPVALAVVLLAACATPKTRIAARGYGVCRAADPAVAVAPVVPAPAGQAGCGAGAPGRVRSRLFHHLRYHQSFPVTREALLTGMGAQAELTGGEIAWLRGELFRPWYGSAAAVMRQVFPAAPARVLAMLESPALSQR